MCGYVYFSSNEQLRILGYLTSYNRHFLITRTERSSLLAPLINDTTSWGIIALLCNRRPELTPLLWLTLYLVTNPYPSFHFLYLPQVLITGN